MKRIITTILIIVFTAVLTPIRSQMQLGLFDVIQLAKDSSATAIKIRNQYLNDMWQYRSYKAERLPSLTLSTIPLQYDRDVVKRYIYSSDRDEYRTQRTLYSYGYLQLNQNVDFTGGQLYAISEFGLLRTFSTSTYNQFTTVPMKVGYKQSLLGYNAFKWDRKIEPLKYEKAKRDYIYAMEGVAVTAGTYFFNMAMAESNLTVAKNNAQKSDSLLSWGQEMFEHGALSKSNLLNMHLTNVEMKEEYYKCLNEYNQATFSMLSFIGKEKKDLGTIEINMYTELPFSIINVEEAITLCRNNNPQYIEMKQNLLLAKKDLDKANKQRFLEMDIDFSVGFNQYSERFKEAYRNLMEQENVSLGVTIPILDWGVRKGKYRMARNNLETAMAEEKQKIIKLEQEVYSSVDDYNLQQNILKNASQAIYLADLVYEETFEKFKLGACSMKELKEAMFDQQKAKNNYVVAQRNRWISYFHLRQLTLHDYIKKCDLTEEYPQ